MEEVGWNVIEAEGLMILFEVAFFIVITTPCKRKMSVLFVRSQPNACWQKEKAKLSIVDCRVPKQKIVSQVPKKILRWHRRACPVYTVYSTVRSKIRNIKLGFPAKEKSA